MAMDPPVAPDGGFSDAADFRRRYPDGRMGSNPGLASIAAGKRFYDAAVEGVAADCEDWIAAE